MAPEAVAPPSAVDSLRFPPTAFPKGKPIQKNLDTRYVNLEALFRSLAQESFGGSVLMVFEEGTEALIIFREGTIITAYTSGTQRRTGVSALSEALRLAKGSRAYVDVFKVEHEILVALLSLLHGVESKEKAGGDSLEDILKLCRKAEIVGALVVGGRVPEAICLIYAGIVVGWYDAQGGELEEAEGSMDLKEKETKLFCLEGADTFASINLDKTKLEVAGQIKDILFSELKELGMVLYSRSLASRGIADEGRASKGEFSRLVEDIERSIMALRGPGPAGRLTERLAAAVETLMDVGF